MRIRSERREEFPAIYALVKTAFATAAVSDGGEQDFVDRLRAGSGYIPELALVAEVADLTEDAEAGDAGPARPAPMQGTDGCCGLAGHVMLTRAEVHGPEGPHDILLLAPLSVKLEYRRQGLGAALTREALRRARDRGFEAVALVGDPAYYGRFGFRRADAWGIAHEGIPPEYVLAMELAPGALHGVRGLIRY